MTHRSPTVARLATLAVLVPLAALGGCATGSSAGGSAVPSSTSTSRATSPRYELSVSERAPSPGRSVVTVHPSAPAVTVIPRPASTASARPTSARPTSARPTSSPPAATSTAAPASRVSSPAGSSATSSPEHRATTGSAGAAPFRSSISRIDASLADRMRASYHEGCPVPLADLKYLRLSYWGFDGGPHTGELVVSARVADDVVTAFRSLYAARFPIHRMRLVDDYGGSDDASMAADNTSAFNCRKITGGDGWSEHSYGEAIDINPVENPYLSGDLVLPPAGRAYLGRPDAPGVIHPGGAAVRAFAAIGWTWGGSWTSPVDLQHFSSSGH